MTTVMKSKHFIFLLFSLILIIEYLYSKNVSNYIPAKQEKHKIEESRVFDVPKSKSSQTQKPQKLDLNQWMIQKESGYQKDRKRIHEVCRKYNIPKRKIINKEFLEVDRKHKMALCSHAKVGSTTWHSLFEKLLPTKFHEELTKKFGKEVLLGWGEWTLKNYFILTKHDFAGGFSDWIAPYLINNYLRKKKFLSFSFVRHPFERLVSAYTDKINDGFMKANGYEKWFQNDKSFSSFVNLVLHEYRTSCYPGSTQHSRIRTNWYNKNCEYKVNRHWRPFVFRCSYCDINYDIIGRMETWNDDLNYIIRKRGIENTLPPQKANISFTHHSWKQNTEQMTIKHFSTLSDKQKEDLYNMFRMDFEMFNYDPKIYL